MLNNLKVGTRLALGFGVALFTIIVLNVISLTNLGSLDESIEDIVHDKFPKTVWANDMIDAINESSRAIRNVFITDDPAVKKRS
ncbi:MAG: MCP four helix bundle domain-containing protein [Ignavibacteriales bacterium]|nr:MCP four helix bundle domain-containing protein [Ignavibacteriales bacterium]